MRIWPASLSAKRLIQGNRGGVRAGVRLVVLIRPAVLSPVSRFLLVPLKRIDYVQKKV